MSLPEMEGARFGKKNRMKGILCPKQENVTRKIDFKHLEDQRWSTG